MPCAVLDGGLQFLATCWQHPPSVPWGVVLSHRGHSTCSKTVKERVCTKTAACLLHHDHTSAVLRLASVPLANSESWVLSQGRGLRKGLAAGGRVAGAARRVSVPDGGERGDKCVCWSLRQAPGFESQPEKRL